MNLLYLSQCHLMVSTNSFSLFSKKKERRNCKLININQKPGMTSTMNGKLTSNQAKYFEHADM